MEYEKWLLRPGEKLWRCLYCGKTLVVVKPPKRCMICGKRNSFFAENTGSSSDVLDRDKFRF